MCISHALWERSYAQNNDAFLRAATAQLTLLTGVTFMSVRVVFHVPTHEICKLIDMISTDQLTVYCNVYSTVLLLAFYYLYNIVIAF